ncbi:MAG: ATP-binding cassette domain-containing protein [Nitriliruptoraceae bacterium]
MHLLTADTLGAEIEGRRLFTDASFSMRDGDVVGVVGPNGVGKSTLLRIVAGERRPDAGAVTFRSNAEVAFLEQDPRWDDAAALDIIMADSRVAEHEAQAMLDQLGIDAAHATGRMSEGQRRRVALARALLAPADLLVLDEPTNHLDVDTVDWFEATLSRRRTAVLLVTHDRYVLEHLATRLLDMDPQLPKATGGARVFVHEGSYSSLLESREKRHAEFSQMRRRAASQLRKEVAWLRRQPRARTSKPRFRVEQVDALRAQADVVGEDATLELGTGRRRLGNDVLHLDGVTVHRGDNVVLDDVSLDIGPGERVGVIGVNGAGKTTLLEVMAGQRTPDAGTVSIGTTVVSGLFRQQTSAIVDVPNDADTVLASIHAVGTHVVLASGESLPATRIAERFGFADDLLRRPISVLSGGERRRLALLHLLLDAPNVLIFDEPTNDLDLDTLAALEDYLDGFHGALIVASHDRYVLDRLTDRVLAVGDGAVRGYQDLAAYKLARDHERDSARPLGMRTARPDNATRQSVRRQLRAIEQRMTNAETMRTQLRQQMAAVAADPSALSALQCDLADVETQLANDEAAWMALAEEHEDLV